MMGSRHAGPKPGMPIAFLALVKQEGQQLQESRSTIIGHSQSLVSPDPKPDRQQLR
jgi:5,10-methylene-tetrahydrofolate dehydrogenase/methenyl tetrahydrofolate cyclohydrolase